MMSLERIHVDLCPQAAKKYRIYLFKELKGYKSGEDSHWVLAEISSSYYEERKYKKALEYAEKALALAPRCPKVLWDYAGTLDMLERYKEAIAVYRRLVRRNMEAMACGQCGEGMVWVRGLIADAWYRMALCYKQIGQKKKAADCIEECFALRLCGKKCSSIYSLREVKKFRV